MQQNSLNNKKIYALGISSFITILFYIIPFLHILAYPFILLSTLVHEMGHGVGALLVGGNFHSFKMWFDASGVASISGNFGNFAKAFVAAAGLVGPAVVASIFFIGSKSIRRSQFILGFFSLVLILSLIVVVRNLFGIGFVSLLAIFCFYCSFGRLKSYSQIVLSFLAIQLSLSVFSRSDYLFTQYAITNMGVMPSDVEQMSQALILPYWFFGGLCAIFSLLVLIIGFKNLLNNK